LWAPKLGDSCQLCFNHVSGKPAAWSSATPFSLLATSNPLHYHQNKLNVAFSITQSPTSITLQRTSYASTLSFPSSTRRSSMQYPLVPMMTRRLTVIGNERHLWRHFAKLRHSGCAKSCLVSRPLGRTLFRSGVLSREVWNITLGICMETATFLVRFTTN
jgi:hypothetical protein